MLCTHKTTFSASLDYFVTSSPLYLHQFSTISGGNCIIHTQIRVAGDYGHTTKMGHSISRRNLPGSITDPQSKCGIGLKYPYRMCQPAIPCKFDETFRTVLQGKWNATWLASTGFAKQINWISHDEDIKISGKRSKLKDHHPDPNGE